MSALYSSIHVWDAVTGHGSLGIRLLLARKATFLIIAYDSLFIMNAHGPERVSYRRSESPSYVATYLR